MTPLFQKIALNLCGIHIVDGTDEVTAADAACQEFRAVKAVGGDLVIASFDADAEITGANTDITVTAGDTLICRFKAITLTSGVAALTKYIP